MTTRKNHIDIDMLKQYILSGIPKRQEDRKYIERQYKLSGKTPEQLREAILWKAREACSDESTSGLTHHYRAISGQELLSVSGYNKSADSNARLHMLVMEVCEEVSMYWAASND